jgi:hypothetical protein
MKTNDPSVIDPVEKAGLSMDVLPGGFWRGKARGRKLILGMDGQVKSFHVMSRTTGGKHLFEEVVKGTFVRVMRRLGRFAGVEGDDLRGRLRWTRDLAWYVPELRFTLPNDGGSSMIPAS